MSEEAAKAAEAVEETTEAAPTITVAEATAPEAPAEPEDVHYQAVEKEGTVTALVGNAGPKAHSHHRPAFDRRQADPCPVRNRSLSFFASEITRNCTNACSSGFVFLCASRSVLARYRVSCEVAAPWSFPQTLQPERRRSRQM